MTDWYSRPVLFVADVQRSIDFYVGKLGFVEENRYEEDGKVLVGEVVREDCALLLSCQEPEKNGHGRMFISLDIDVLVKLRVEFEKKKAPVKDGWWGYETMIVRDPDGNELFFPYPEADAEGEDEDE